VLACEGFDLFREGRLSWIAGTESDRGRLSFNVEPSGRFRASRSCRPAVQIHRPKKTDGKLEGRGAKQANPRRSEALPTTSRQDNFLPNELASHLGSQRRVEGGREQAVRFPLP